MRAPPKDLFAASCSKFYEIDNDKYLIVKGHETTQTISKVMNIDCLFLKLKGDFA